MKIGCRCGGVIFDHGNEQANKAHFIPSQTWFGLFDAIDAALEKAFATAHATPGERDSAIMGLRKRILEASRSAWQCTECGTVYVEDRNRELSEFVPAGDDAKDLFRA